MSAKPHTGCAKFAQRFGLAWLDTTTQDRTLKQSGEWFGQVADANGLDPEAEGTNL